MSDSDPILEVALTNNSNLLSPVSKSKGNLQLQAVQVGFATADGVVQLGRKSHVVVEIVASAEGRAVAQADVVVDQVVGAGVHILIAEERTKVPDLLGNLGVERGRVEDRVGEMQRGVANEEGLVEKLDAVSQIDHIGVDDGLAVSGR